MEAFSDCARPLRLKSGDEEEEEESDLKIDIS